jgi:hypothetical protein
MIDIDEVLEQITLWPYGMPVRLMEQVLELGEASIAAVAGALDRSQDDAERDPLWLVVMLGELRSPDAVPVLIRQISRPDADILAQASAEGLAKIGAGAVPALREAAETGDATQRLYAYAALGWIDDAAAQAVLVEALGRDRELADVVATALVHHGGSEMVTALFDSYQGCEPWQRPDVEEAIRFARRGGVADELWHRDWRLRYRRRPELSGGIDLEWPVIAEILRRDERARADRAASPLLSLDEILTAAPLDSTIEPELCDDCGGPVERPMAVPMCPGTAVAVGLDQLAVLTIARQDGIEDLFELLDELEEDEYEIRDQPEPRKARAREEREETLADFAEARATCEWLIEHGVEEVTAGETLVEARVSELAERHGDPDGLLSPATPVRTRAEKVGRNDPCPCGSGRKYKRCCLDGREEEP